MLTPAVPVPPLKPALKSVGSLTNAMRPSTVVSAWPLPLPSYVPAKVKLFGAAPALESGATTIPGASGDPGFSTVTTPASSDPSRAAERAMSVDSRAAAAVASAELDATGGADGVSSSLPPQAGTIANKVNGMAASSNLLAVLAFIAAP